MHRAFHSTLLGLVFFSLSAHLATAQQKIGYVNTDVILQQIPEYDGVQQQLSVISEDWRKELEEMEQKIDTLKEEFKAKEILYSDKVKAEKQQQIRELEQARKQYLNQKFGPEGEFFQRQKKLLEPIQRMVYEAITAVSQRQNIDFVFDRAQNSSLLFGRKQWNLNKEVLQELGITLNQ